MDLDDGRPGDGRPGDGWPGDGWPGDGWPGDGWPVDGWIDVRDEAVAVVVDTDARLERLATGCEWSEGPVYLADRQLLLWSDIPNNRIQYWSAADNSNGTYRTEVEYTNGHTLDRSGRLVSCSHGNRRIERTEPDGSIVGLVDQYQGRRLNSPNDVVVKSDGTIWFTDPPYGILSDREGHAAESEIGDHYVYRFDPETDSLIAVTDVVIDPNGLAFSPDESVLYVSDTSAVRIDDGLHRIWAFDVIDGVALANPRSFADVTPGLPDGFRVTELGHVLTSCEAGIQIFDAEGHQLGSITVPEVTSNCCFGGPEGTTLFITATSSVYRIELNLKGRP